MDALFFSIEQSLDLIKFIYRSAMALAENYSLLKSLQSRIKRIRLNLHFFCAGSSVSKVHEDVARRLREDFNLIYNQLQPIADRVSKPTRFRNFLAATNITKDLQSIDARLSAVEKHLDTYGLMLNLRTAYQFQEDLLRTLRQLILRFAGELCRIPSDPAAQLVSDIAQLSLQQGKDQSRSQVNLDMEEGKDLKLIQALPSIRRQFTASKIAREDKDHVCQTIDSFENKWRLSFNDLTFETRRGGRWKVIGKGGFSTVYAAHLQLRGEDGDPRGAMVSVAVKELEIPESELEQHKPHFLREVHTLMQFAQPYILHTYGAIWPELQSSQSDGIRTGQSSDWDFSPMIIMERMTFDLANAISDRALQNTEIRRNIATDIATALSYLHQNGLVHGDVKPENVFLRVVGEKLVGQAKLGDFGESRRIQTTRKMKTYSTRGGGSASGTIIYMPPEVLEDIWNCKTRRSWDVWSFGLLLCFLGGRKDVFSLTVDVVNAAELAKSGRLVTAVRKWAESIGDSRMKRAALQCLEGSWQRRATMEAVLLTLTMDLESNAAVSVVASRPKSFDAAKKDFQKFLLGNDREKGNEACYVFKKEFDNGNLNAGTWLILAEFCSLSGFRWPDGLSTFEVLAETFKDRANSVEYCIDYAVIKLGFMLLFSSNLSPAVYHTWKAASDDGNLLALVLISECLYFGVGVKRNTQTSAEVRARFFELAEEAKPEEYDVLEWSEIRFRMGFFNWIYYGQEEKGAQYMSEAVDLGNPDAALYLSYVCYIGCGAEQDVGKADELIGIAMRRGSSDFYGSILRRAIEIEPNIDEIDWGATRPFEKLEGILDLVGNEFGILILDFAQLYKFEAYLNRRDERIEEAQRNLEKAAEIMRHWRGIVQKDTKLASRKNRHPSSLFGIFRHFS